LPGTRLINAATPEGEGMLSHRNFATGAVTGFLLAACICVSAQAQSPAPRPDLADIAAGIYDGNVISDARGSSRSNVRLTVTKTGPNTIYVTSSYPRLPPFSAKLTRAMNTIQKVGGSGVFLLDLSKRPVGLDVTDDDASWSGAKSN
jgi:hypothetical protein